LGCSSCCSKSYTFSTAGDGSIEWREVESSTQPRCRQNSRGHRELDDVVIPGKTVTRRVCRARRRDISWSVEWVLLDPKVGSRWERRTGTGWAASAKVSSVTLVSTGRHAVPSCSGVEFPSERSTGYHLLDFQLQGMGSRNVRQI
jgi:hypothetical protein